MRDQLERYINRYVNLTNSEFDLFLNHLSHKRYKTKEFLLQEGNICEYRYFILKGLIRFFHKSEKGTEKVNSFAVENWWITDLDSFINNKPSFNSIQAIEDTSVLMLSKKDLEHLCQQIPKLERLFRLISEKYAVALQRKEQIYMRRDSINRYRNLVNSIPNFDQRVPQYMIASYLGITPEYLSEIKKSM
jgi:CRP-like cAMP-binding protein